MISLTSVVLVYIPNGKVADRLKYESGVDEIYDVKILPGLRRPGILNTEKIGDHTAVVTPKNSFWGVSEEKKG